MFRRRDSLEQIQAWIAEGRSVHPVSGLYLTRYLETCRSAEEMEIIQAAIEMRKKNSSRRGCAECRERLFETRGDHYGIPWLLAVSTQPIAVARDMKRRFRRMAREDAGFTRALPR